MPVLGTKLHPPVPRRALVARPRLTDILQPADAQPRLLLLAAPAGFGKTTLLVQWLQQAAPDARVAWLSLDAGDADLQRFLTHLVAAVAAADDPIADTVAEASVLVSRESPAVAEEVLTALVNGLDALDGSTVIALDDFHVLDTADTHDAVAFLLDNLPPHVSLAITTRVDPPLPLARWRARGELVELRAADLRFTPDEAGVFLNDVMGLSLAPRHVTALEQRTEGWAAGLQLAALSARQAEAVEEFVDAFAGSHRFVLDYLVEEVLDGQPADVTQFLLETSVLDQLTGPLCDAVTGRTDSQTVLEGLEHANLFLLALDDHRTWWRYHHLFGDTLRSRLEAHDPVRAGELHALAAGWYADHDLLEDAVPHAIAGGDLVQAGGLVERATPALRRRREDRLLRTWLLALPDDEVRRRAPLAAQRAWVSLTQGDLSGASTWLDAAENVLGTGSAATTTAAGVPAEHADVRAMVEVYRAAIAQAEGDVDRTVDHAGRALEHAGPEDHFSRGAASGYLGLAAWAAGDAMRATDTFQSAVTSLRAAGNLADALGATVVLAQMWMSRGRPDRARSLLQRALDEAARHPPMSTTGDLHVGLAALLCEQGDLPGADAHLQAAADLGDRGMLLENRHRWHTTHAAVERARGHLAAAVQALDAAEPLYLPGFLPDLRPIAAQRARLLVATGRLDDARAWARSLPVQDPSPYLAEFSQLTLARLHLAEGRAGDAIALLEPIVADATERGRAGSLVDALVVQAIAGGSVDDLDRALDLGVPAGYVRAFLDEGAPLLDLLHQSTSAHARALLTHHQPSSAAPGQTPSTSSRPGGEPLSDRELEVLRLLASDLSGPDIARHLYVSLNTLRTHTKHIFTKLDVNTRRAAVRRAQDAGLI